MLTFCDTKLNGHRPTGIAHFYAR